MLLLYDNDNDNRFDKYEWENFFINEINVIKTMFQFGLISKQGGGSEMPEWDQNL